jgi:hypothetical protein
LLIETGARAVAFWQLGWWYLRATKQALNTLPVDFLSTLCRLLTSDTLRRLRRTFLFGNEVEFGFCSVFLSLFCVCHFGNEAVPLIDWSVCLWVSVRNATSHLLDFFF